MSTDRGNVILVSSWDTMCGIAIYTKDLLRELEKLDDGRFINRFKVKDIKSLKHRIKNKNGIVHLQHEFGIMPKPPKIEGSVVITFHTVPSDIGGTLKTFESSLDIVAYIVSCHGALEYMVGNTKKDLYVTSLGSKLIRDENPNITKEIARKKLGIPEKGIGGMPMGFVFGFQSKNKNYERLLQAAIDTGIHIIISGSVHSCGYMSNITDNENVTILGKHLNDEEIDLYALASDLLLYDYAEQDHYSASASLHRTIGAGRPAITVDTKHFNDIQEKESCVKFSTKRELEMAIWYALSNQEYLSNAALEYARRTSWRESAMQHVDIYSKYIK